MVKPELKSNASQLVPNGTYQAKLTRIRQFNNAYGARIGFEFTLQGSGVDGVTVMSSTSSNLSTKSKLTDLLEGIMGRSLIEDELQNGFDVEGLIDSECSVLILQSRNKLGHVYSNVERVFK